MWTGDFCSKSVFLKFAILGNFFFGMMEYFFGFRKKIERIFWYRYYYPVTINGSGLPYAGYKKKTIHYLYGRHKYMHFQRVDRYTITTLPYFILFKRLPFYFV